MKEILKRMAYIFGFISLIYSFLYIKEFGFDYFVQLTCGMGMFQGAFIVSLSLFLLIRKRNCVLSTNAEGDKK